MTSAKPSSEHLLVRGRGLLEETLLLGPTPQSLVTEGIGTLAPDVLLEGDGWPSRCASASCWRQGTRGSS